MWFKKIYWLILVGLIFSSFSYSREISNLAGKNMFLKKMKYRVVFFDNRLSASHSVHIKRLLNYLVQNGFHEVNANTLKVWMKSRIKQNQAYGSVVVMTMGVAPETIVNQPGKKALWYRYLMSGGRIVWLGDIPYIVQQVNSNPLPQFVSNEAPFSDPLGIKFGWNLPYWGNGTRPVKLTSEGKKWGFETTNSSITGVAENTVSIPFSVYDVPGQKVQGTSNYLINVSPDMPWGGFIFMAQGFDGNNDATLRDVWRAADYVGTPVKTPSLPSYEYLSRVFSPIKIEISASGIKGGTQFVRGEKAHIKVILEKISNVSFIQLSLIQKNKIIKSFIKPFKEKEVSFILDTFPYAYGSYILRIEAINNANKIIATKKRTIGIRFVPPENFNLEIWAGASSNPYRENMTFANIKNAGFEISLGNPTVKDMDMVLQHNMGFSLQLAADRGNYSYKKNPEFFRVGINRKVHPDTAYGGGRPELGITNPVILDNVKKSLIKQYKPIAEYPALRPYILTNDDYSVYYGWDFSKYVVKEFKKKTGLDAPKKMLVPAFGIISDNDPWVQWCRFSVKDITGRFNKVETKAVTSVRPDTLIGPIPGGMQIPLVSMWNANQYPPYNFGKNGFNLICSYYYNTYWQPIITTTYWMEIGRMGNHNLPEWNMPDCFMTALYTRNNFFQYLAGGVHGLDYFVYSQRNNSTWPELKHLGQIMRRIGPVQSILWPSKKIDIGLLNSFTCNSFDPGDTITQSYAYDNLIQGHFDVEPISDEGILAGRDSNYKAILLYDIKWIRQSVYRALLKYIARGGLVLLDDTIPFNIPGAKRLSVDLGMGQQTTQPFIQNNAVMSIPGRQDYSNPEHISVIQKALSLYIKPYFKCKDIKIGAWRLEADGYPYTWFIDMYNAKQYMFCLKRMGAGVPGSGTPKKIQQVINWEKTEISKGQYTATVIFNKLPGIPYDLVRMKRVPVKRLPNGQFKMFLSMERFGGMLVAWLPERITRVKLNVSKQIKIYPSIPVQVQATVIGKSKPIPNPIGIEFLLKNPQGKISVISVFKATHEGTATFRWTPAINDLPGKWILQVKELASGKTAKTIMWLSQ